MSPRKIAAILGKKLNYVLEDFHKTRSGHDRRYALDGTKLKEHGFTYPKNFEDSLKSYVEWTINNPKWL
jgi:dTDP-glucose 4,6-dehydratase